MFANLIGANLGAFADKLYLPGTSKLANRCWPKETNFKAFEVEANALPVPFNSLVKKFCEAAGALQAQPNQLCLSTNSLMPVLQATRESFK